MQNAKTYRIRRAETSEDGKKLNELFTEIFHPEPVGIFAETIFHHFPHMKKNYWFIAEDLESATIISAFALIPWTWELQGVRLNVAEMGIVGTRKAFQNRGIIKQLTREFDQTIEKEHFDFAVIQGIPGFYHKLGFHYSISLENHINIPLHLIPADADKDDYTFCKAEMKDLPFLIKSDDSYRNSFSISAVRDPSIWEYMLTASLETEYGSEFWIMEHREKQTGCYFRIPSHGFGKGLIISEVSEFIDHDAIIRMLIFCKKLAVERGKPYIRLNMHHASTVGKVAIHMGAEKGHPYAWQIKIPNPTQLLKQITPVLEKRIAASCFKNFSGKIRLDFFKSNIDLTWKDGRLVSVSPGQGECDDTFFINPDMFPALCLGHRTWQELQYIRPDIFPATQYLRPNISTASDKIGLLTDTLFPSFNSWIYQQY